MFLKIFGSADDGSVFNEYLVTIVGGVIYFCVGVHTGWTSPYLPFLQSDQYPFIISNEAASYMAICGPIGDVIGEVTSTLIVDKIGRKNTLLLGGFPILTSFMLIYFAYISPIFIYIARILGGVSLGTATSITSMYICEISRPSIRGKLGVFSAFSFITGLIVVNLIGNYLDLQQSSLIFSGIALFFLCTFSTMPESPYYLIMKKNLEKAENSLRFFRRKRDIKKEMVLLTQDVQKQVGERGEFRDLWLVPANKKAVVLMIFSRYFQQLTGCTALTMYAQNLLESSRDFMEPHFTIMIIYSIQAWLVLVSGNLSDRFGRVPLLTHSMLLCFVTLLLQAVFFTVRDFTDINPPIYIPAVLFGLFFFVFQLGIRSLVQVLMGEMFSTSIKPKAICVANINFSITVMLTTKFYQISEDYLHISVCFYVFAIFSIIGAGFFKLYVPETKGRTLEEIQTVLRGRVRRTSKLAQI